MMRMRWALVGLTVAVVAVFLLWGIFELEDRHTFVIGYLGLLANVVMAGAAVTAFSLWRAQVHGQAQHAAATRAMRVAFAVDGAIVQALHDCARFSRDKRTGQEVAMAGIEGSDAVLARLHAELEEVSFDVRATWGDEAWTQVENFRAAFLAFEVAFLTFGAETRGIDRKELDVSAPPWSWRGAMRGDVDDVMKCASFYRRQAMGLARWGEANVDRGRRRLVPRLPPEKEKEQDEQEAVSLMLQILGREGFTEWVAEQRAVNASRDKKVTPAVVTNSETRP